MNKFEPDQQLPVTEYGLSKSWLLPLGWFLFVLGVIGIVLPLMPTTVFWIGAVWCWSRSAPHLTKRILSHPRFGQPVYLFITHGQMTRVGKWMALGGICVGVMLFFVLGHPDWPLAIVVCLVLAIVAVWLWQRPEPILSSRERDAR